MVGPGTSISIDTALVGSDSGTFESLAVGMTGGLFRMISGNSESDAYRVNTPSATMGIRGTAFDNCVVRDDLLIVHEGIVQSCLRNPATGEVDLASCVETEAQENACPITAAAVTPDGDGSVGPANPTAILQCRLSYQQEELGVLEDFRIDGNACRAAADAAAQDSQQPEEEPPAGEGEDETQNFIPPGGNGGGSSQAAARGSASSSTTNFLTRRTGGGGGPDDLCSKDDVLATLEERASIYEDLINQSGGDEEARFVYQAALRTLRSAIRQVERTPLVADECATLQATLATSCRPTVSPATLEDRCVIAVAQQGVLRRGTVLFSRVRRVVLDDREVALHRLIRAASHVGLTRALATSR